MRCTFFLCNAPFGPYLKSIRPQRVAKSVAWSKDYAEFHRDGYLRCETNGGVKSIRIVHVMTRLIRGGADENTQLTCNHQARAGHDITLVVGGEWEPSMRKGLDANVRFLVIPSMIRRIAPAGDWVTLLRLFLLFRRLSPDLVHTHTSKAGILGRLAAVAAGVPKIVHSVHILPFINVSPLAKLAYVVMERICGSFTHAFLHVSGNMREECLKHGIGRSSLHAVAESGMETERFRSAAIPHDGSELLKSPIGAGRPFVLLMIAVLERRKGQRNFLKVFERIVATHPNSVLLLAGDGVERDMIEGEVERRGLKQHVRLLGYRRDPECLLAIADCVVICSQREGLPRVAVQAALAQVPIVSTALPGIEATVTHGKTGFIVPLDEIASMEGAILQLIEDPALTAAFRRLSAAQDFSAWSVESMMTKILGAYADIMSKR